MLMCSVEAEDFPLCRDRHREDAARRRIRGPCGASRAGRGFHVKREATSPPPDASRFPVNVSTRAAPRRSKPGSGITDLRPGSQRTTDDRPQTNVSYAVKEIYYTLQGEGAQAGRPAVFCRFAGCNLWSGREADRAEAVCQFCDTDFVGDGRAGRGKVQNARGARGRAVAAAWPVPANAGITTLRRLHRRRAATPA